MEEAKEEALVFIDEDENVLLEEMPHESADNTQDDATDDNDLASFYEDEFSLEHRVQNTNQNEIDAEWYLHEYPDVAASGMDPVEHYLQHGMQEGRFYSHAHKLAATLHEQFSSQQEAISSDYAFCNKFIEICLDETAADALSSSIEVEQSYSTLIADLTGREEPFGIVVLATVSYFSTNCLQSLLNYGRQNLPIVIIADNDLRNNNELAKLVATLKQFRVKIYYVPPTMPTVCRLGLLDSLRCTHVAIFTMLDTLNQRSYVDFVTSALAQQPGKKLYSLHANYEQLLASSKKNPCISALSGLIFHRESLLSVCTNLPCYHYFVPEILLEAYKPEDTALISPEKRLFATHESRYLTLTDASLLMKDALSMLDNDKSFLKRFVQCLEKIMTERQARNTVNNNNNNNILASGCALMCARMYAHLSQEAFRNLVYNFSAIFKFDLLCNDTAFHAAHKYIVSRFIPVQKQTIAIVETDYMQDLQPRFVPACREQGIRVIYISKPQYYDYHWFYCMVMRAVIQPARFVVTSNYMHHRITAGKAVLTLWHGLGMLKNITAVDTKTYPMNAIVTSSKDCVAPWAKTFSLPEEYVFPLGNMNTDVLFDQTFVQSTRAKIRKKYGLDEKTKVVFFAPTFRDGETKTYDFGMDVEAFSRLLKKHHIFMLVKRHHVFVHTLKDKHRDTSGLQTSHNGWFAVDEEFSFVELICAADAFMTDYSSGLFYAVLRDLPLILYAPDIETYDAMQHGFMIDYPSDIPAEFVGEADANKLMMAIQTALSTNLSNNYADFKRRHVGSCDGMATKRCITLLRQFIDM